MQTNELLPQSEDHGFGTRKIRARTADADILQMVHVHQLRQYLRVEAVRNVESEPWYTEAFQDVEVIDEDFV